MIPLRTPFAACPLSHSLPAGGRPYPRCLAAKESRKRKRSSSPCPATMKKRKSKSSPSCREPHPTPSLSSAKRCDWSRLCDLECLDRRIAAQPPAHVNIASPDASCSTARCPRLLLRFQIAPSHPYHQLYKMLTLDLAGTSQMRTKRERAMMMATMISMTRKMPVPKRKRRMVSQVSSPILMPWVREILPGCGRFMYQRSCKALTAILAWLFFFFSRHLTNILFRCRSSQKEGEDNRLRLRRRSAEERQGREERRRG
ncbi:hypothetical protein B0H63DRAFT_95271 [Podospora didyma]|uniref:Uncharacterized protein n=1 Tax=Podospora didyma TaxID=330526 RepID=A0AAE0U327_9PEZI|nr:hypothetical protein B0H63DRAFT_95271 [Podospora didyma]